MGRRKMAVKRIDNAAARQAMYTKRKEGLFKKANELSILCDTDVALILFSPSGRLSAFAGNGRKVEDILLRFVNKPDELRGGPIHNEEYLSQKLKQLRNETEMLEKITVIEELEEKLDKLNRRHRESQEKMRYYDPDIDKITTVLEAGVYQQFLTTAIQRINVSKAKLAEVAPDRVGSVDQVQETAMAQKEGSTSGADPSLNVNQIGMNPMMNEVM